MNHNIKFPLLLVLTLSLFVSCFSQQKISRSAIAIFTSDSVDVAIINGKIIDGTGSGAYNANVYIKSDSIFYIGNLDKADLKIAQVIDAKGKYVTPGFIDLHAHGNPLRKPEFENCLAMGVTTVVLGQDGSSPETRNIKEYIDKVNHQKSGVNIIEFVGHGTLRDLAGIGTRRKITSAELEDMKNILRNELKYTFGLSTGLEYAPGLYAEKSELLELAKVVGEQNKMIMSHMRNEDDDAVIGSIRELSAQGKYTRVHISHLKSVYGKGAKRAKEILDTIQQIRNSGVDLTADAYPYTASYTGISILFPDWSKTSEQFEIAKRDRRTELENFIRNKVISRNGPEATLLGTAPYTGKTLKEAADAKNKLFEKFLIEDVGPQGASAAYFVMDKDLQQTIIKDPLVGICSDGSATSFHPRGHGTFAKIIQDYVVKDSLLSLTDAIRKMTSYAAEILQLKNRGILKNGFKADILVFDPKNVKANADYIHPHLLAKGFEQVLVNGKLARENEKPAGERHGKVLLP